MSAHTDMANELAVHDAPADNVAPLNGVVVPSSVTHSTGPRTSAGKAIAARNAMSHGIYTLSPVVDGLESMDDWNVYHQAMLASLAPVGMLEETLAERSILTAWRLRRITGYETRQILLPVNKATDKHSADARNFQRQQEFLRWIETAGESVTVSESTVHWLFKCACEVCLTVDDGVVDGTSDTNNLDDILEELPEPCDVGEVRARLNNLAEQRGTTVTEMLGAVQKEIAREQDVAQRQLAVVCHGHLMPDDHTLNQVMRYESHLARLFHRDLHELERLKAARNGQPIAAPMVMDIDLAGVADGSPA